MRPEAVKGENGRSRALRLKGAHGPPTSIILGLERGLQGGLKGGLEAFFEEGLERGLKGN